jgi:hypothetical protein
MVLSRVTALQDSERGFSLSADMAGHHTSSAREHRRLMIESEKGRPTVQIERKYQRPDDQDGPSEPGAIPDGAFA